MLSGLATPRAALFMSTSLLKSAAPLLLLAQPALADINFPDFSSTSGLNLVGSTAQANSILRLTSAQNGQAGAAWFSQRQNVVDPFVCEFTVQMVGAADGMAFVIQRSAQDALGNAGGSLGYSGVPNSIAIELDTFVNGADPSENHVAVHTQGISPNSADAPAVVVSSLVPDLNDGGTHTVRIEYTPGALRVSVDGAEPTIQLDLDIASTLSLGGGGAWVGFTAATGGLTQVHDVLSWTFDEASSVPSGNDAPVAPVVIQPDSSGSPVSTVAAAFQLGSFFDPDGGAHACTDYEIWREEPAELVWRVSCGTGSLLRAAPLSAGTFQGSLAGQDRLAPLTNYVGRARMRDDSGDPLTHWSPWSERSFVTDGGVSGQAYAAADLKVLPTPELVHAASGRPVELGTGAGGPRVWIETGAATALLGFSGSTTTGNLVTDGAALSQAEPLRIRVEAGASALTLPASEIVVRNEVCQPLRLLLPAIDLPPGGQKVLWITGDGSTWEGLPTQTTPVLSTRARGPAIGWDVETGYQVDVVAEGLTLPVNLAFVPEPGPAPGDPFLYFTELYGRVMVMTNDGTVSVFADNLLNFNPLGFFPGAGEQGLGGLTVDPQNGDLWLSLLYDAGGPHYPRLERLTSVDGGLTMATRTTVLDMPGEAQGQAHYVSHIELMADGTVLLHMGDGFNTATARNLDSFRGKILRLNRDGTPVTSNPYYTPGAVTARDYVYVLGVRNPFGGRTRASDGQHYFVDNGPSVDRFAKVVPGRDYLWDGSNASMNSFASYAWNPAVGPVNLAFIEQETFGGSGFPSSKWDHAFVSGAGNTYSNGPGPRGKNITEFVLDAQGNLAGPPTQLLRYSGSGRSAVVGCAAGPNGLYFTDLYPENGNDPTASGARILRVRALPDATQACGSLGAAYCGPAVPNSSGGPASLLARGSDVVTEDDLTLEGLGLPANTFALLVASRTQTITPNAGGSSGTLCIGGTIGRFNSLIKSSDAAGTIQMDVPLGSFPPPLPGLIPGQTYNFQLWFRDFTIFPTSNFTDGRSITFR